jgi:hypothetical protein
VPPSCSPVFQHKYSYFLAIPIFLFSSILHTFSVFFSIILQKAPYVVYALNIPIFQYFWNFTSIYTQNSVKNTGKSVYLEALHTVLSIDLLHNVGEERIFFEHVNKVVEYLSGVFDSISEAGDKPESFIMIRHAPGGERPAMYVPSDPALLQQLVRDGEIVLEQISQSMDTLEQRTILDIRHQ